MIYCKDCKYYYLIEYRGMVNRNIKRYRLCNHPKSNLKYPLTDIESDGYCKWGEPK